MRLRLWTASLAGAVALSYAQVPANHDLKLVGGRFAPLTWDALTPEQRVMVENLFNGERHGASGPFNVWLRAPELGDELQAYGVYIRYHPSLSRQITEFVIMTSVRYWNTESEWNAHKTLAVRAGLDPAIAAAIAEGARPQHMPPDVEAAYNFVDELLTTHQLSDKAFRAAKDRFGEKGVVDMMGAMGYYGIVSFALNVDGYPLPNNVRPELKQVENTLPVANPLGFATPPEAPSSPIVFKTSTVANGKKMILRGDRFPGLSYDEMTPLQRAMADRAMNGRGTAGTFNINVRDVELTDLLWPVGERVRFHMTIGERLKELSILIAGRYWGAQFEWLAHRNAGIRAGLAEATVRAIAEGGRPADLPPDEQAVYNFCTEYFKTRQVSDATFQAVKDKIGERGIVEIIGSAGQYQMVSLFMNVDRYPLELNQKPELMPLAHPLP
jgi:4-carboxymuconolactone decarboxylase